MNNQGKIGLRSSRDNWFTCVDTVVLMDKELSQTAKLVFMVLCAIAGFGSRSCSPSNEEVADVADVSVRTVIRAYRELEARGVITRESRFDDGQQVSSCTFIIGHNAPCYGEEDAQ